MSGNEVFQDTSFIPIMRLVPSVKQMFHYGMFQTGVFEALIIFCLFPLPHFV